MKSYEVETIVTVEAAEIERINTLPNRTQLELQKEDIAERVSDAIKSVIGADNHTSKVKVKVFIHGEEA